ncbi:histone-lysine N-methyltransferase SETD2 isoform X2 [Nematostella vectensis]|uniref:histone-lysine N-methyltransferase SETD2 isoform X2 n=1 Tax=Nematostella vectensis TaxID=45351 RepID=UPI00138FAFA5|nr:histone-lysine N-methyltransferase SETD2 isoform X2 [Nematostella vectensis]
MKSDSSERSESCGEEESSDEEVQAQEEQIISSTEEDQPPYYENVMENIYLINRKKRINKEVRKMTCECYPEPDNPDFVGCGEDCLNRLLMIECNHRCPCGDLCTNRRFQEGCKIKVEVFKTEKKGWGVKTLEDLEQNQFVIEYCGEVMNYRDFQSRAQRYDRQKRRHYYFMTLRADEIIDATLKGSISRFINHSCEPNCVTQKWTVNGLLRIGFFTLRTIKAGEELTFDYQLQRYGKIAQTCYCESPSCRGIIGGEKHTPLKTTVEKIATPSANSPRRKKKRNIASDFEDVTLEDELERLIGDHRGMTVSDQALKLSRLMVRAEDMPQRIMLLRVLQNTTDQSCLKAFLRYQGLSLLWSWMVDAGAKPSSKLQLELLATLKYLPVSSKNQLEDSKVMRVVNKWAIAVEEVPSSCSSSQEESNIDDVDRTLTQEDVDENQAKDKQNLNRQLSDNSSKDEEEAEGGSPESKCEETKSKDGGKSPDELSEDDSKSAEEDPIASTDESINSMANELLKQWSTLKEIYRIPKKTPVKKKAEVVVATSSTGTSGLTSSIERELRMKMGRCSLNRWPEPQIERGKQRKTHRMIKHTKSSSFPSLPDSSVKVEAEPVMTYKEETSNTLAALMSIDVPLVSKAEPSTGYATPEPVSKEDLTSDVIEGKTSVSSSAQVPSGADGDMNHIPTVAADWGENQVFGYNQQMGKEEELAVAESEAQRNSRSRKQGKKSKWSKQGFQPFASHGPQVSQGPVRPSYNVPSGRPWQDPSLHWTGSILDQPQGIPYYGPQASGGVIFQQGPYPSHMPANAPPPNIPIQANFPRNIPPPNYIPPTQQMSFQHSPYNRPPPNVIPTGNMVIEARFHAQQHGMPPQPNTTHMQAPGQVPFPGYGAPQGQQQNPYPYKMVIQSPSAIQQDTMQPRDAKHPEPAATPESMGPESIIINTEHHHTPAKVKPRALPPNWKTATDPQGKIYYYHTLTRRTQWDPPTPEIVVSPRKFTTDMEMDSGDEEPPLKKKKPKTPSTPPGSPPRSPTLAYTTAPADTTENQCNILSPPGQHTHGEPMSAKQKIKDAFRVKLSNVVVNCLNPYHKVDCKQGRITNVEDFKYLARKLTHGVMMKELQHVKSAESLQCNDSVKVKTKDYIRSYMKKFGPVYQRT